MKRLAVSVVLAARNLQIGDQQASQVVRGTVRAYRERMAELGVMGPLDVWYDRVDIAAVLAIARQEGAKDLKRQLRVAKIRQRTSLRVLPKLTQQADGTLKIIDDPPLDRPCRPGDVRRRENDRGVRGVAADPTGGPCCSATGSSTRPGKSWGSAASAPGAT